MSAIVTVEACELPSIEGNEMMVFLSSSSNNLPLVLDLLRAPGEAVGIGVFE